MVYCHFISPLVTGGHLELVSCGQHEIILAVLGSFVRTGVG